ncbi:efflux RND transporter periplasmic adaptor subunit [Legionella sp. km535]|uniref:efflux RND transporter periplasmic adaptor subunit n=1 Tax=Legionella sp. km535 TaxID=2498107 RepID=UPI000F8DE6B8|nr:efflux RND transporter periplasmic adaptor subunit [Legionella sp. km535]RUR17198.1 efflux RND transporter periplasmic adaptor subunit [Legionella sp. km535]
MHTKRIFIGTVFLIGLFLAACKENKSVQTAPRSVPVVKVALTKIPLKRTYIGITQSIAEVGIRARVEGFLIQKNFIEGKPVKKDQLIYVIDPKPFQAQLDLAKGQLAKSIANMEYQKVQYLRLKELVKKGDVSQTLFDETAARYGEAQAETLVQKANVETAEINLGYCSMIAPFDGIIGKKYVDVGNLVGSGESTLLANIVQLNPIYVLFSPSVEDYGTFLKYRKNMPFHVEAVLPYDNKLVFKGKVDLVNNQADTPTSTILMRALVDNPAQLLLPGIYVNITLELTKEEPSILIPASAVTESQGQRTVYLVNEKKQVEVSKIQTSGMYKQQYIVTSGVKEGDLLIINGIQKVLPDEAVIPEFEEHQGQNNG